MVGQKRDQVEVVAGEDARHALDALHGATDHRVESQRLAEHPGAIPTTKGALHDDGGASAKIIFRYPRHQHVAADRQGRGEGGAEAQEGGAQLGRTGPGPLVIVAEPIDTAVVVGTGRTYQQLAVADCDRGAEPRTGLSVERLQHAVGDPAAVVVVQDVDVHRAAAVRTDLSDKSHAVGQHHR